MFRDRIDAAHRLAERLQSLRGRNPLILAIPRGAVPMGKVIADALEGELDVVLVHKLGAPGNPELAIGAIDEEGTIELTEQAKAFGIDEHHIRREAATQLRSLRERRRRYTPVRPPIDPAGRRVVVVDDGSATGATMMAALQVLRPKQPARLIAAMAVAPPGTIAKIERSADEVVCLRVSPHFWAVGQFFQDFRQVTDDEVIQLLATAPGPAGRPG
jgi:predicted phosphoribosyltransferase